VTQSATGLINMLIRSIFEH